MTCKDIVIIQDRTGWFVFGHNDMGPFTSRDTAVRLGRGLVAAVRAAGDLAELHILEGDLRAAPPTGLPDHPAACSNPALIVSGHRRRARAAPARQAGVA